MLFLLICLSHFLSVQQKTMLILGGNSVRAQKAFALDYCASAFVTEGKNLSTASLFHSSHFFPFLAQSMTHPFPSLSFRASSGGMTKHGTASVCVSIV